MLDTLQTMSEGDRTALLNKVSKESFGITVTECRDMEVCVMCHNIVVDVTTPSYEVSALCPHCVEMIDQHQLETKQMQ